MNKIILFANVKGGVGKTTLCATFANYLRMNEYNVVVVDADLQQSLAFHRQDDLKENEGTPIPYHVVQFRASSQQEARKLMEQYKTFDGYVLIDCPGNLNDPTLATVFKMCNAVIVPMAYDPDTIRATKLFAETFKRLSNARLIYVPNRINDREGTAEEFEKRKIAIAELHKYGWMTQRIKQNVNVKRYDTLFALSREQLRSVEEPFKELLSRI